MPNDEADVPAVGRFAWSGLQTDEMSGLARKTRDQTTSVGNHRRSGWGVRLVLGVFSWWHGVYGAVGKGLLQPLDAFLRDACFIEPQVLESR